MRVTSHPTPNPNSLKFVASGATLIDEGLLAFNTPEQAAENALGAALFALPGVHSLMIVPEFVTVTKQPAAKWKPLSDGVEAVIRKFTEI